MSESKLNIKNLPREILVKVVRYLDQVTLKNVALTCQMLHTLTVSEGHWPLELGFDEKSKVLNKLHKRSKDKFTFIMTTNRRFESIRMYGHLKLNNQMLEIFQKHGPNVAEMRCCIGQVDSIVALAKLLNLTPDLTYVDISLINGVRVDVPLSYGFPRLKELKTLRMFTCDQRIIKCFQEAKLTTMIFGEEAPDEVCRPLVDFLSSQDMLTSLFVANSCRMLAVMKELNVPIPFRLKRLAISGKHGLISSDDHGNLLKFLRTQLETLEEFEIGQAIPHTVFQFAFESMTKLNSLSVIADNVPQNNDFSERLMENCSVITLDLVDYESLDVELFGNFLKKLPNIRTLSSSGTKNTLAVAQNLTNLESLYIGIVDEADSIDSIQFTNLKTLHIKTLRCKINWNRFTQINSRLTELTIGRVHDEWLFTSDDIDKITTNVQLQSLRLGPGFSADDRFFEIIRAKCPNLKVLDLYRLCVSHELILKGEIKALQLCDDIKCSNYAHMLKM